MKNKEGKYLILLSGRREGMKEGRRVDDSRRPRKPGLFYVFIVKLCFLNVHINVTDMSNKGETLARSPESLSGDERLAIIFLSRRGAIPHLANWVFAAAMATSSR